MVRVERQLHRLCRGGTGLAYSRDALAQWASPVGRSLTFETDLSRPSRALRHVVARAKLDARDAVAVKD